MVTVITRHRAAPHGLTFWRGCGVTGRDDLAELVVVGALSVRGALRLLQIGRAATARIAHRDSEHPTDSP